MSQQSSKKRSHPDGVEGVGCDENIGGDLAGGKERVELTIRDMQYIYIIYMYIYISNLFLHSNTSLPPEMSQA